MNRPFLHTIHRVGALVGALAFLALLTPCTRQAWAQEPAPFAPPAPPLAPTPTRFVLPGTQPGGLDAPLVASAVVRLLPRQRDCG